MVERVRPGHPAYKPSNPELAAYRMLSKKILTPGMREFNRLRRAINEEGATTWELLNDIQVYLGYERGPLPEFAAPFWKMRGEIREDDEVFLEFLGHRARLMEGVKE